MVTIGARGRQHWAENELLDSSLLKPADTGTVYLSSRVHARVAHHHLQIQLEWPQNKAETVHDKEMGFIQIYIKFAYANLNVDFNLEMIRVTEMEIGLCIEIDYVSTQCAVRLD